MRFLCFYLGVVNIPCTCFNFHTILVPIVVNYDCSKRINVRLNFDLKPAINEIYRMLLTLPKNNMVPWYVNIVCSVRYNNILSLHTPNILRGFPDPGDSTQSVSYVHEISQSSMGNTMGMRICHINRAAEFCCHVYFKYGAAILQLRY